VRAEAREFFPRRRFELYCTHLDDEISWHSLGMMVLLITGPIPPARNPKQNAPPRCRD
jgi:hypothetical protein